MKADSNISGRDLSELRTFQVARPVTDLVWNWAVIAGAQAAFALRPSFAISILCAAVIGVHLHRLLILGHEAAHYLLFRNRAVNDFIANVLCFFPVGATVEGYRDWHLRHHRFVGTADDPELIIKRGWWYARPSSISKFMLMASLDIVGCGIREIGSILWDARPRKAPSLSANSYNPNHLGSYWIVEAATSERLSSVP